MKRLWWSLVLCPSLALAQSWSVEDLHTKEAKNAVLDSGIYAVSQKQFPDDITLDQQETKIELTTEQLHQAQVWGLTEAEEQRFVQLMQNRSALYYKDTKLSPTEILGLNARTQQEREHYAALAALQNEQQISQLLAWRNAYQSAYQDRTKNLPVIKPFDTTPFSPYAYKAIDLKPGDQLYFYLRLTDTVNAQLTVVYRLLQNSRDTKLTLILMGDDANLSTITAWAKSHGVPVSLVKQKRILLRKGDSADIEKINHQGQTLPLMIHSAHDSTSIVDMSRF